MRYLGIEDTDLVSKGAILTAKEISQQPVLWQKVWNKIEDDRLPLQNFLNRALKESKRIILMGAGTSAFIGLSLRGIFQRRSGLLTEAISTTDIVSHPWDYFHPDIPTLVISFARSGNSPESVAAIALADEICKSCYHLIITCNPDGKLANYPSRKAKYVFRLPSEANDQGLAMTGSYSTMLLAGILIAEIKDFHNKRSDLEMIIRYGEKIINHYVHDLRKIALRDFKRAVFLGSGPFFGAATESHLKLQELTDGIIICQRDSFLGFRHGPKAVVDRTTLIVYIFSNDDHVLKYEKDLVVSMKKGNKPLLELGIMESEIESLNVRAGLQLSENGKTVQEEFLAVCSVLPAQILGFHKSLQLGLRPDNPSASGAITRIVEGVNIYSRSPIL